MHLKKVEISLAFSQTSQELSFDLIFNFFSLRISFLIRDVCSRAALMEVPVCQTRKSKPFHAHVSHLGLETDAKLDWVIMTWL